MNHRMVFPVLRGGIAIHNPMCDPARPLGPYGTLGLIATSDDVDRWIVSCYHVLCRIDADFPANQEEPIYQPFVDPVHRFMPAPIAIVSNARINRQLDCAAARITPGQLPPHGRILGIGKLSQAVAPQLGMRVIKSGAETSVTEGIISRIWDEEFEIAPRPDGVEPQGVNPTDQYELSEGGDSGAIWVDAASGGPVGLHYKGSERGFSERAYAKRMDRVMDALGLRIVID